MGQVYLCMETINIWGNKKGSLSQFMSKSGLDIGTNMEKKTGSLSCFMSISSLWLVLGNKNGSLSQFVSKVGLYLGMRKKRLVLQLFRVYFCSCSGIMVKKTG